MDILLATSANCLTYLSANTSTVCDIITIGNSSAYFVTVYNFDQVSEYQTWYTFIRSIEEYSILNSQRYIIHMS